MCTTDSHRCFWKPEVNFTSWHTASTSLNTFMVEVVSQGYPSRLPLISDVPCLLTSLPALCTLFAYMSSDHKARAIAIMKIIIIDTRCKSKGTRIGCYYTDNVSIFALCFSKNRNMRKTYRLYCEKK